MRDLFSGNTNPSVAQVRASTSNSPDHYRVGAARDGDTRARV